MRGRPGGAAAGAVLLALAAGCTPPSTDDGSFDDSTRSTSEQPAVLLSWANGSPVQAGELRAASAHVAREGDDFSPVLSSGDAAGDFLTLALDETGGLVVARLPAQQYDGGAALRAASEIGLLRDGVFDPWPGSESFVPEDAPRQAYAASVSAGVTVWVETASVMLDRSSWRVFSRDPSGVVALVARSEEVDADELPIVNGDTTALVSGGRVYWATAAPVLPAESSAAGASFQMQVLSRAVDGSGSLVVEAVGASHPTLTDDGLFVTRTSRDDAAIPDGQIRIERSSGIGTTASFLEITGPAELDVLDMVGSGHTLALATGRGPGGEGSIYLVDTQTSQVTRIALDPASPTARLALCGDLLSWSTADGSGAAPHPPHYVMSVSRAELSRIPVERSFGGAYCSGDLLAWRSLGAGADATAATTVVRWASHG